MALVLTEQPTRKRSTSNYESKTPDLKIRLHDGSSRREIFKDLELAKYISKKCARMKPNGPDHNVTLSGKTRKAQVRCHEKILSHVSQYLRRQFLAETHNGQIRIINLHLQLDFLDRVSIETLLLFVQYAYCGSVLLDGSTVLELLQLANILEVDSLKIAIATFLAKQAFQLNAISCYQIYTQLQINDKPVQLFKLRALQQCQSLFFNTLGFLDLDFAQMCDFLSSEDLKVDSEDTLLDIIHQWYILDPSRVGHMTALLSKVRLPLLSEKRLHSLFNSLPDVVRTAALRKQIELALDIKSGKTLTSTSDHPQMLPRKSEYVFAFAILNQKVPNFRNSSTSVLLLDTQSFDIRFIPHQALPVVTLPYTNYLVVQSSSPTDLYTATHTMANSQELLVPSYVAQNILELFQFNCQKRAWVRILEAHEVCGEIAGLLVAEVHLYVAYHSTKVSSFCVEVISLQSKKVVAAVFLPQEMRISSSGVMIPTDSGFGFFGATPFGSFSGFAFDTAHNTWKAIPSPGPDFPSNLIGCSSTDGNVYIMSKEPGKNNTIRDDFSEFSFRHLMFNSKAESWHNFSTQINKTVSWVKTEIYGDGLMWNGHIQGMGLVDGVMFILGKCGGSYPTPSFLARFDQDLARWIVCDFGGLVCHLSERCFPIATSVQGVGKTHSSNFLTPKGRS